MKASDLRIGNLVYDNHRQIVVDVALNTLRLLYYNVDDKNYTPIPLTEEWLLKFGFVGGSKTIGNFYISVTLGENDIYINDGYGYEGAYIPLKCQYVHQLQNIYFALTGEELTLKE